MPRTPTTDKPHSEMSTSGEAEPLVCLRAADICTLRAGNSVEVDGVTVKPLETWGGTSQRSYEADHGRLTNTPPVGTREPEEG